MQFADLKRQYEEYRAEIDAAMSAVIEGTRFINGEEVSLLEQELSAFSGAEYSIACSSGTDALLVPLMAKEIEPGDEIIVPAFTYIATGTMVAHWGAKPVFVDVDPVSFNIDPERIEEKITGRTKGIFAVSLYGQPADFQSINAIAEEHGLWVLEDGAQSFGAKLGDRRSCSLSHLATTSFFPAKPLGCFGDGGAIFTDDEETATRMRQLINHGQVKRYYHRYVGINGRMDTIQAAVLRVKLRHFQREIEMRQSAADYYDERLTGMVRTPVIAPDRDSTWAQYTVRVSDREAVRKNMQEQGVPTSVHYPMPLNRQEAFAYLGDHTHYEVAETLAAEVLSLPMHAFISREDQDQVIHALGRALDV
jgi:UDP-2-acetamido-2-deoxy-ribo-hexuluronate aminotransferase